MEFKRLEVFPNYRIYINGDIYSEYKNGKEKLLKHRLGTHGYYYVTLCHNGKQKHIQIHRLVAILFIPNPDVKNTVDHINRIKIDNRLENLRWANMSEQTLNQELKENTTGYPFIAKSKNKNCKSGFCFMCQIKRNGKHVLSTGRTKLEDAVELVRTFLLENEYIFDGYDEETKLMIKEKYK